MTSYLEQFYVISPIHVLLIGGRHDGEMITLPDGTTSWCMITLPEPTVKPVADPSVPVPFDEYVDYYRWQGRVLDNGVRVFQCVT